MDEDALSDMYGLDDPDNVEPLVTAQPEQLRLAGKATLMPFGDKNLAVPKIEYVEALERQLRELNLVIESQGSDLKKLSTRIGNASNHMEQKLRALEQDIKQNYIRRRD